MPGDLKKLVYASEYNIKEGNCEKVYKVANVKCYAVLNSHTQGFDLTVFLYHDQASTKNSLWISVWILYRILMDDPLAFPFKLIVAIYDTAGVFSKARALNSGMMH